MDAFAAEAATEEEIQFDLNDFDANPEKLRSKLSTNQHKNFLNINVVRDKHKARVANMMKALEERLHGGFLKEDFKMERFKSKIHKPDGKLSMMDLKKLNSVYRGAYTTNLVLESDEVKAYVQTVKENLEQK